MGLNQVCWWFSPHALNIFEWPETPAPSADSPLVIRGSIVPAPLGGIGIRSSVDSIFDQG